MTASGEDEDPEQSVGRALFEMTADPPPIRMGVGLLVRALDRLVSTPGALYWFIKAFDNHRGDGTTLIMGQRATAAAWLRRRQFYYEPLSGYDEILRTIRMWWRANDGTLSAEALRDHVQIAFWIFPSAYTALNGNLALPSPGERPVATHAVMVAGWEDAGETLVFVNSWGAGWGARGYGRVTRQYLDRYLDDAYLVRNARTGPSRVSLRQLTSARDAREFARAWRTENPRVIRRLTVRGRRVRVQVWETCSANFLAWTHTIVLVNGVGMRLGWAMISHLRSGTSIIHELFVWPPYRRTGLGSELEAIAVSLAKKWGAGRIELYMHGADAVVGEPRKAAREFGSALGYKWNWRTNKLPNLAATGEKQIP